MGNKVNFSQVIKELAGFDEPQEESQDQVDYKDSINNDSVFEAFNTQNSTPEIVIDTVPLQNQIFHEAEIGVNKAESSMISSSMVIKGNIKTNEDIIIEGCVFGDVNTSSNLKLNNVIVGKVKAQNIQMDCARVKGDIKVKDTVKVGEQTIVVGDIACNEIFIHGKIKGDLDVSESTFLDKDAAVVGNIVTNDFLANGGSFVKGTVTSSRNADFDEDVEFDLGVDIDVR